MTDVGPATASRGYQNSGADLSLMGTCQFERQRLRDGTLTHVLSLQPFAQFRTMVC